MANLGGGISSFYPTTTLSRWNMTWQTRNAVEAVGAGTEQINDCAASPTPGSRTARQWLL
jgi:hypothetical protein